MLIIIVLERGDFINKTGNFRINKDELVISINPKLFPLEVIYSAAYMFLDETYIFVSGDPDKEILIQMKAQNKQTNLKKIALDFNNQLINYAIYAIQAARNQPLRKAIIERALATNICKEDETADSNLDYPEDPLGISKTWEESKIQPKRKIK